MASGAQSITLQLNSSTVTKTSEGSYRIALEPPISIPYLAEPRAQLTDMAFVNCQVNVAEKFKNNVVEFQIAYIGDSFENTGTSAALAPGAGKTVATMSVDKTHTLTVPDGHYSLPSLELELARIAYKAAGANVAAVHRITATTSLWQDMQLLVKRQADPQPLTRTTGTLDNDLIYTIVTVTTAVPPHYIGAAVALKADLGPDGVDNGPTGTIVTHISNDGKVLSISAQIGDDGELVPGWEADFDHAYGVTLTPIAARKGYGVAAVAEPSLNPSSHWGEVLAIEEMELIATTPGVAANTIVPIVHAANSTADILQSARYVKPFYLKPDFVSNKVKVILACPAIAVKTTSTLFTKVLGFRAPIDFKKQDPFLYAGKAWTAGIEGTLVRVRSLVFHCPTLIDSSYDQTGKKSGAQLGVVPVTVPFGSVQVWQAAYNNSVPCALHGANISTIESYVRDQDLSFIDLQSTAFQATVSLSWDDPRPPGADAEQAYGIRDIAYGYQRG